MKIIADTNILIRAVVEDEPKQTKLAQSALSSAKQVILGRHALCELAWVLRSRYRARRFDIAMTIRHLCLANNVVIDRSAVELGLAMLEAGADFADGVIAYEGAWLGGETFVSFDKKAVAAIARQGIMAKLLE